MVNWQYLSFSNQTNWLTADLADVQLKFSNLSCTTFSRSTLFTLSWRKLLTLTFQKRFFKLKSGKKKKKKKEKKCSVLITYYSLISSCPCFSSYLCLMKCRSITATYWAGVHLWAPPESLLGDVCPLLVTFRDFLFFFFLVRSSLASFFPVKVVIVAAKLRLNLTLFWQIYFCLTKLMGGAAFFHSTC